VRDILVGGPKQWSGLGSVLRFFNSGMFVGVLGVGVVGVAPLVLPTQVVRIAVVVTDFVILYCVCECLQCSAG
jgi:hypothetical protein